MIENMKKQFAQLLYDIGFLTSSQVKDKQANHYSSKNFLFLFGKLLPELFLIYLVRSHFRDQFFIQINI